MVYLSGQKVSRTKKEQCKRLNQTDKLSVLHGAYRLFILRIKKALIEYLLGLKQHTRLLW